MGVSNKMNSQHAKLSSSIKFQIFVVNIHLVQVMAAKIKSIIIGAFA